ncbi:UPF0481 protein At3g47200-like [Cornus florida]|uniref:UPF0481 protein At3g47200-like n=1 Tax=Cornus florida TaxID=4283 RepID=UPI00289C2C57|nr:UPF0481 protein At3g47200-like [Cornus florida]
MLLERRESCSSDHQFTSSQKKEMAHKVTSSVVKKIEDNQKKIEALRYFTFAWPRFPVIISVPNMLREENVKAYNPSLISIGPLHRGNKFLQAMEADKVSYMCCLFKRTGDVEKTREVCEAAMLKMQNILKKCYADQLVKPDDEDDITNLIEMMLIDGCFIIELVYRHSRRERDPILNNPFKCSAIRRDLLLLDNQIPFVVLEMLFGLTVECIPRSYEESSDPLTLIGCVLSFFGDIMGLEDAQMESNAGVIPPLHILHLLHICYQPQKPTYDQDASSHYRQLKTENGSNMVGVLCGCCQGQPCRYEEDTAETRFQVDDEAGTATQLFYSAGGGVGYEGTATQLEIAGVKLRKRSKTKNLFDVEFRPQDSSFYFWRGCLEIPRFSVYNFTESFLRNIIAFEQCYPFFGSYFTSHAFLMDILMDSVDDVKLLEKVGVICNHLGTSESVLQIFNGICKNAYPQDFHYDKQWRKMKGCCTHWREELGTVKRNCAGNLWIVLSVIGAISLFVLTLLQTVYTMNS